ncbi:MAG: SDR family NAD(P)-dependent oxidoreductase [Ketobacter sp.]|nr:MAG: SDR family NAD(P)-dependent oxidoreductase [Ketobacter sp.]
MKQLSGKVAVITGAAGGIGSALAMELANAGMDIVLADIDVQSMEDLAEKITSLNQRCICFETNVSEFSHIQRLLDHTLASLGDCHLLINNAGIIRAAGLFSVDFQRWQQVIDVNLNGVLYGSRVFGEYFISKKEGHIVNVSSAAALFPMPGMTMYTTSKIAVESFTMQLRWELHQKGVGVTLARPGTTKSKIYEGPQVGLPRAQANRVTQMALRPEGLARKIRRAVQHNRALVSSGAEVYLFGLLRLLPMWLKDPIGKLIARTTLKMLPQKQID